jgi:Regulator of volume decrease after cellular swelling
MQLELSDPYRVTDEDEPEIVELTLIPSTAGEGGIKELFEAVSNCSNLHMKMKRWRTAMVIAELSLREA